MLHQVPRIDITQCSPDQLVALLAEHSCVLLENHGVDVNLREAMLNSWDEFFALPRSEKEQVEWPGDGPWYGWQPVSEKGPKGDLMERFELRLDVDKRLSDNQNWGDTFTKWPVAPVDFRQNWEKMYFRMREFAGFVMGKIAAGLGRDDWDADNWTDNQFSNLVATHYYAQPANPNRGQWRAHPHTDIGALTLLWGDSAPGGLEVAINGGKDWVPVQIPEDCWLLQAGDLLNLWSGNTIPANPHRVANPPREQAIHARRSIIFFHYPDPSVLITPPNGDQSKAVLTADHIQFRQDEDMVKANAV
ncbi:2OG-Fe(II) oxygenase family protein [Halioxenophilus aromaticivorans]|uniref:2-oxoglutarate-dependent ethylene/succinate-forming enzyme n=1 Tax=Halioxenophilus aromaticivorans TaxID=1306992 RepID=A0AAV3UA86_9ALTE